MTMLDGLKALGVALLLMVLNVAASFVVMWVWGTFIDPGHDEAYYVAAAQEIAPWSSIFVGALLFFGAGWWLAKRRPDRNGVAFAITFSLIYAAIDIAIVFAVGAGGFLGPLVAASMMTKVGLAVLGAWLARSR